MAVQEDYSTAILYGCAGNNLPAQPYVMVVHRIMLVQNHKLWPAVQRISIKIEEKKFTQIQTLKK